MATGFAAQIKERTDQYRKRLNYVAKSATGDVVDAARLSRFDGGRMPIDTSNLQKSMVASTKGVPSGPSTGNENKTGDDVTATIVRWNPVTERYWAGFSAVYARVMEYRYGFLRGATQQWPQFVRKAVKNAKSQRL